MTNKRGAEMFAARRSPCKRNPANQTLSFCLAYLRLITAETYKGFTDSCRQAETFSGALQEKQTVERNAYLDNFIAGSEQLTKLTVTIEYNSVVSEQTERQAKQRTIYFYLRDEEGFKRHMIRRYIAPLTLKFDSNNPFAPKAYDETLLRERAATTEEYLRSHLQDAVIETAKNVMIEALHLHSRNDMPNINEWKEAWAAHVGRKSERQSKKRLSIYKEKKRPRKADFGKRLEAAITTLRAKGISRISQKAAADQMSRDAEAEERTFIDNDVYKWVRSRGYSWQEYLDFHTSNKSK